MRSETDSKLLFRLFLVSKISYYGINLVYTASMVLLLDRKSFHPPVQTTTFNCTAFHDITTSAGKVAGLRNSLRIHGQARIFMSCQCCQSHRNKVGALFRFLSLNSLNDWNSFRSCSKSKRSRMLNMNEYERKKHQKAYFSCHSILAYEHVLSFQGSQCFVSSSRLQFHTRVATSDQFPAKSALIPAVNLELCWQ